MPNGIIPAATVRTTPEPGPRWGLKNHFLARWRRNRLDAELAAGATPDKMTPMGLRAAQLQTFDVRERLAHALIDAVADARSGQPSTIEHPQRGHVRECDDQLIALASRLRSHQPIEVRGAAMVALLVNDRLHRTGAQQLRQVVAEAHSALIPAPDVAHDLSAAA
jgi:hypothetical protein